MAAQLRARVEGGRVGDIAPAPDEGAPVRLCLRIALQPRRIGDEVKCGHVRLARLALAPGREDRAVFGGDLRLHEHLGESRMGIVGDLGPEHQLGE